MGRLIQNGATTMLTIHEAVETLFAERINIEVMLTSDEEGYAFYNMRARPWKNSPNDGRMLLVGGPTLDECMVLLADALLSQSWTPLSWTARLHVLASEASAATPPPIRFRQSEAESPAEARSREFPYTR
jgi:hypothetical protein